MSTPDSVVGWLWILLTGSGPDSGLDSVDFILGLNFGSFSGSSPFFGSSPAGVGSVFGSGPNSGFGFNRVSGPDSVPLGVVSGSGFWSRF